MTPAQLPQIIQGGMGAGVSGWPLARAVSLCGQLGVVAGTGLDGILARRLQLGDPGGHMRRALASFPIPEVAQRILDRYFIAGGKDETTPFKATPMPALRPSRQLVDLLVAGNFAEVFLAREGHDAAVGVNFLEKIQAPLLPSLYGAMLAGASVVLMGAGIPRAIPGIMDRFASGAAAEMCIDVRGSAPLGSDFMRFDPSEFFGETAPTLARPDFYSIIASNTMATIMATRASGRVDGFVVEGPTAGGHNAPPRGAMKLTEDNQPIYGPRDVPDLNAIADFGLPFWLAGSYGRPGRLAEALELGAAGIQVGTAFAYCEESGIESRIKRQVLRMSRAGKVRVVTDPLASPTGFPFKIVQLPGSSSDDGALEARTRVCDLGFLRQAYRLEDGNIGWRCPGEPTAAFLRKGGAAEAMEGRQCVCNGLMATIGLSGVRKDGYRELPMLTSGDDVKDVAQFLAPGARSYRAADVIQALQTPNGVLTV